jgi:hypothetical protein
MKAHTHFAWKALEHIFILLAIVSAIRYLLYGGPAELAWAAADMGWAIYCKLSAAEGRHA